MRAGVRDVLPLPIDGAEITAHLTECLSEKRVRITNEHGNLAGTTCFIGAKGGCGTTTLAVNAACSIAARHEAKIALLDFDMQFGDVALYMDIQPQATMLDAISQSSRLDTALLTAMMTKHPSGVDVLASPANIGSIEDVTIQEINKVLETVVETYDFVLIDMPTIITPWTVNTLKFSEHIMLVLQNCMSAIKNGKRLLTNLPEMGINGDKIEVINNRAMCKTNSIGFDKLKSTLGRERIHRVRNDYNAALTSQDQGMAISNVSTRSKASKDIDHFSDYMWQRQLHIEDKKEGMFSRWFGHQETQSPMH